MIHYYKIGKLAATHGFDGMMVLQHSLGKKTALKGLAKIFLEEHKDSFLPYFIQKASIRSEKEILIKLEGYDSKEICRKLLQQEVWLTEEDFEKYAARSAPISWLGFTIIDNTLPIGEIIEVIEMPHQILCKVIYKGKEVLIPVHENSLLSIDKKNRKIIVELPEGLLDVYGA